MSAESFLFFCVLLENILCSDILNTVCNQQSVGGFNIICFGDHERFAGENVS